MSRSFWLYLIGQVVSVVGDAFGLMAIGFLAYDLTESKVAMGSLFAAYLIPEITVRMVGAPLIDRLNRLRLMAGLDIARAAVYALPPLLAYVGQLELWHLYLLNVVAGASGALFLPSSLTVIPALAGEQHLARANSLIQGFQQGASLLAPGLAGFVIAQAGSVPALLVNAISFLGSAGLLLLIPAKLGQAAPTTGDRTPYIQELLTGFRFFRLAPSLLVFIGVAAFYNLSGAALNLLIPFVEEDLGGGPAVIGLLSSAVSAGMLLGAFLSEPLSRLPQRRLVMVGIAAVGPLSVFGLGLLGRGSIAPAVILQALFGLSAGVFTLLHHFLYQRLVPNEVRGRVVAVRMTFTVSLMPLFAVLVSALAEAMGTPAMFLLAGGISAAVILTALLIPGARQVDGEIKPVAV